MKQCVLGSGSEGNAILFQQEDTAILIDAGFSAKQIIRRMESHGLRTENLAAICLTHEHSDHIRGAGVLARRLDIPVFATPATLERGGKIMGEIPQQQCISNSDAFMIGPFRVRAFTISHDAADPVGYIVESGGVKAGLCTDIGHVTHLVRERLSGCHSLVLEMNHDVNMLIAGAYPWALKQRIRSRRGHLSNDDCGHLLKDLWHRDLQHIFLAHLSRDNNLPQLARLVARQSLDACAEDCTTEIHIASQHEASELITLNIPSHGGSENR